MLQLAATDDKGTSRGYAKSVPEVPGKCFSNPAQCLFVLRCKCTARKELHRCGCRIKLDDAIKCPYFIGYPGARNLCATGGG